MNDYLIHYVVYKHNKALKPLETLKITIKAYCKANAKEKIVNNKSSIISVLRHYPSIMLKQLCDLLIFRQLQHDFMHLEPFY